MTLELIMVLPMMAMLFVLLVSVARALNVWLQAGHTARYAAQFHFVSGNAPDSAAAKRAVRDPQTTLTIHTRPGESNGSSALDKVVGSADAVLSATLLRSIEGGAFRVARYEASGAIGPIAWVELSRVQVSSQYVLPTGLWASSKCGGTVSTVLDLLGLGRLF